MEIEETLVILKPDALEKKLEFEILDRLQKKGFMITELVRTTATEEIAKEHYAGVLEKKGPEIYNAVVNYISSGPIIVAIVEGNNAIEEIRAIGGKEAGPTDCEIGTIRRDYSNDSYDLAEAEKRAVMNLIHTSDSVKAAKQEIELWFGKSNLEDETSNVYQKISNKIGLYVPDLIENLIHVSDKEKILYHGVKKADIEDIVAGGIKPITPEAGPGSCWSTGVRLFEPDLDSPFFRYSGSFNSDECELTLAMVKYDTLLEKGIDLSDYRENSQMDIKDIVPFDAMTLINVKLKHHPTEDHKEARHYRRMAEQIVFGILDAQVHGDLTPGIKIEQHREIDF